MLSRRGETIGQVIGFVVILQVFRTGVSCRPHIAVLGLELHSLRGRDQSEIVFGVLKIVLRGDRVATCVSVARQLKVFFRYMQRRAANSNVIVSAAPRRPSELLLEWRRSRRSRLRAVKRPRSAQMPALSVSCQITKRQIQSVDFVRAFALSGPPDGSLRERLRFNSNGVAESRFEIVNRAA